MSAPRVGVVVPVRDGARVLAGCLDALAGQQGAPSFEVVVVDNASTDGSGDLARRHPLRPRVVVEQRPGSYAARMAGVAATPAELLAFTDADCRPEPGWLAAAVAALDAGADVVGGAVTAAVGPSPGLWERYDRAVYLDQERAVRDEGYAATANLVTRRAVLDAVGGFDVTLRSSGDLEWGQRAGAAGFRLVYAPDARVDHRPRTGLRDTWSLHRRLGAGWRDLARDGRRPPAWREPALRVPLRWVVPRVRADGLPLPRARLVAVHATAMAARWAGRLAG